MGEILPIMIVRANKNVEVYISDAGSPSGYTSVDGTFILTIGHPQATTSMTIATMASMRTSAVMARGALPSLARKILVFIKPFATVQASAIRSLCAMDVMMFI